MTAKPYFLDQYGHIYRWQQKDAQTTESVSVANFQQYGSRKESEDLIDKANAYSKLVAALKGQYDGTFEQLLRELGEAE